MTTVLIMIGIPGIGKSTWIKNYLADKEKNGNAVILNADTVREELYGDPNIQGDGSRVFGVIHHRFVSALRNPLVDYICLDNTNLRYALRAQYYNSEGVEDAKFVLVYFPATEENIQKAKEQNQSRSRVVPEHVIDSKAGCIQPPNEWEVQNCEIIRVGE